VPRAVLNATRTPRWNISVPDLTGRAALVTGSTRGIGLECVRRLGAAGAEVIMVAREEVRATRLAHRLRSLVSNGAFRVEYADLADLASIRELASRLIDQNRPISVLINNAGVRTHERRTSADGFELQFAVNHLAPFALTGLLLPLLRRAHQPRVVALGSLAARARLSLDDLQKERPGLAYAQSKLAQLIFIRELDRRSRAYGWQVEALAAHPGIGAPGMMPEQFQRLSRLIGFSQSPAEGALPVLLAATDPYVGSGEYYGPRNLLGMTGPPGLIQMPAGAADRAIGHELWDRSEELTGVVWPRH
jgi:NAD(P)-dependent dehydrogenase (short-subunit alcohol dehydrogenase family)